MSAPPDFRQMYEDEFSYVWNSLRRLGVPSKDLEDLAHDTFMTAYKKLDTFEPGRPVRPWLFGIAYRIASDFRRLARNQYEQQEDEDGPEAADGGASLEEQVSANEARAQVKAALDCLELDRRAVFVMHEIDGHAMPEIASALGAPLNTCYSRLRLARQDFAAAVRRLRAQAESPANRIAREGVAS